MNDTLSRMPNYTCLETIERSQRLKARKRFDLVDTIRIEVALVNGKELFSWPGESSFKERDLREIAPTGAVNNGSFAILARAVFLSQAATIRFTGFEAFEGREAARYSFDIPVFRSGYHIRIGQLSGVAGQRGEFWVDKETLDLLRLDVEAVDIPSNLPMQSSTESLRYQRVPIGESTFLLPHRSELVMVDTNGNASRNAIAFSNCRQYAIESTLSFGDVPVDIPAEVPRPALPVHLPAGIVMETELTVHQRLTERTVGDTVEARVRKDVRRKGEVIVPKGAIVRGRFALNRSQQFARLGAVREVAVEWYEISFDNRSGPVSLKLETGGVFQNFDRNLNTNFLLPSASASPEMIPHRNLFYVRKEPFVLPAGMLLYWRTLDASEGGAKKP